MTELDAMRGDTPPSLGLAFSGIQGPRGDTVTTPISGVNVAQHHLRHLVETLLSDFVRFRKCRRERLKFSDAVAELLHLTKYELVGCWSCGNTHRYRRIVDADAETEKRRH